MNATRLTVRAWTLGLGGVVAEVGAARLRWCVLCGRVGLRGWQPLCAAMPITWICADQAGCRHRQDLGRSRRERGCRLVVWRRPGLARPPTGRPWHPAGLAGPGCAHHGPVAAAAGPEHPSGELAILTRLRLDATAAGRAGGRR